MKKMQTLSIKVTHPDPKVEEEGAKALEELVKALGLAMGEEVVISKREYIEDHDKPDVHSSHEESSNKGKSDSRKSER